MLMAIGPASHDDNELLSVHAIIQCLCPRAILVPSPFGPVTPVPSAVSYGQRDPSETVSTCELRGDQSVTKDARAAKEPVLSHRL